MKEFEGKDHYPYDLGALPPGWASAFVGDICADVQSGFASGEHNAQGDGVPHLRPMNIDREGRLVMDGTKYVDGSVDKRRLRRGDVLFNNTNSPALVGKTAAITTDEDLAFSNHMTRLRPMPGLEHRFLAYELHSLWMSGYFARRCKNHVNQASVSADTLATTVPIAFAPSAEQSRIADVVDAHLSRLDAAAASLEAARTKLKAYRASVLKAAVEGRLVPTEAELARAERRDYEPADVLLKRILVERRRRWEDAELAKLKAAGKSPKDDKWKAKYEKPSPPDTTGLPNLPEGWCWTTVEMLADVGTGATPNRSNLRYWMNGTIPWVTSAVATMDHVTSPSELITETALAEANLTLYPPGTLLVAMYGEGRTRGHCTELRLEATTNQALAALVTMGDGEQIRPWLRTFMDFNYENVRRLASGGVQPNLNLGIVRGIRLPLPPLAEQRRIVGEVERVISSTLRVGSDLGRQARRSARLRQSILKWAFEGKLVDQDPNDEPAEKLLERIRAEPANTDAAKRTRRPRKSP